MFMYNRPATPIIIIYFTVRIEYVFVPACVYCVSVCVYIYINTKNVRRVIYLYSTRLHK